MSIVVGDTETVAARITRFLRTVHNTIAVNELTNLEAQQALKSDPLLVPSGLDSEILSTYVYSGFEFRKPQPGESFLVICDHGPEYFVADGSETGKYLVRGPGSRGYTPPNEG